MSITTSPEVPGGSKVRIRMYRQGLGDCFLLTFYGDGGPHHILIDCGVLSGTPNGSQKILRVGKSIAAETQGKLQALVATHEHWDHVSGFYDAAEVFDPFDIGEIWVAWTEDPSNATAQNLKRQNQLKLQAVHLALTQMARTGDPQFQASGRAVAALLGFFGGPANGASLIAFSDMTGEAMTKVTQRQPAPTYLKPGQELEPAWLPGVKVHVLGPPEDPALLRHMAGKVGKDIYGLTGADDAFNTALEGAALAALEKDVDPQSAGRIAAALPFNPTLQWFDTPDENGKNKILEDPQFGPLYKAYMDDKVKWRRIDQDWLLSVARLGLQLDSATNNTSLVLAFEFTDTREVLLFAADAQIGNWQSWADKAADLLQRTVFYKVGHHGSHNATLKEGGLEAMTNPNLVAAIPVDQNFANNSKHWEMPAAPLYARLQERTQGRILRADAAWPGTADQPPPGLSAGDWRDFAGMVQLDPDGLFIDFYLK